MIADLTEAVEAAAIAAFEAQTQADWADQPSLVKHAVREAVLACVTAAAPHVEAATRASIVGDLEAQRQKVSGPEQRLALDVAISIARKGLP